MAEQQQFQGPEAQPYALALPSPISLVLTAAVVVLLVYLVTRRRMRRKGLPPGLPAVPVLGSIPFMYMGGQEYHEYLRKLGHKYGSVYSMWLGKQYTVVLNSHDVIREALVGNASKFAGRATPKFHASLASNPTMAGIAEAPYSAHWKTEKTLFRSIMKQMHSSDGSMEYRILSEVDHLLGELQQRELKEEVVDPRMLIKGTTLNVLSYYTVGSTIRNSELTDLLDITATLLAQYFKVLDINVLPWLRFLPPRRKALDEFLSAHQQVLDHMDALIRKAVESDQDETNFVKEYLKRKGQASDDGLVYTLRDILIAGTLTAATTIIWGLLHMANNPDVQVKVQREIDSAVRGRHVRMADMTSMPFTEAVLEETHRISAALPLPIAHEVLEDAEISGYTIPKGSNVMVNLWAVSRDPELWDDPDVFRPERFLTADGQFKRRPEVIPFSLGRRTCPGQDLARREIFLVFTNVLRQFRLSPPEGVSKLDESAQSGQVFRGPQPFSLHLHKRRHNGEVGHGV